MVCYVVGHICPATVFVAAISASGKGGQEHVKSLDVTLGADETKIIESEVAHVLQFVNPIASKAIDDVKSYEDRSKMPNEAGTAQQREHEANRIASTLSKKMRNVTVQAAGLIQHGHDEVTHMKVEAATLVKQAKHKAVQIQEEAIKTAVEGELKTLQGENASASADIHNTVNTRSNESIWNNTVAKMATEWNAMKSDREAAEDDKSFQEKQLEDWNAHNQLGVLPPDLVAGEDKLSIMIAPVD